MGDKIGFARQPFYNSVAHSQTTTCVTKIVNTPRNEPGAAIGSGLTHLDEE